MRIRTQEPKKNVDPIFVHFGTPFFPFSRGSVVKFLLCRSFLFLDDLSESFFMSIFPFSRRSFLFLDDLSDSFFMLISLSRRSVGKFSSCRSLFLDDLSESFFMSIFHNGRLRTMKANYRVGTCESSDPSSMSARSICASLQSRENCPSSLRTAQHALR